MPLQKETPSQLFTELIIAQLQHQKVLLEERSWLIPPDSRPRLLLLRSLTAHTLCVSSSTWICYYTSVSMSVCVKCDYIFSYLFLKLFFWLQKEKSFQLKFLDLSPYMHLKRNYAHEKILKEPPKPLVKTIFSLKNYRKSNTWNYFCTWKKTWKRSTEK